jgi:hypothetical protein
MSDITVIMAGPSTSCALTEIKITEVVNEVFNDDNVGGHSFGDDSDFDHEYTQLVSPERIQLATVTAETILMNIKLDTC